ncbi:hypothetical protein B0T24DRAFT_605775 [Lasiosphaeria ovina]|uniref:Secreted protein n=1 Tax=Lasiosphaeria ovina TaxID=92902 RepID=A0AAE0NLD1_9PEZI|nr:hypothetical protein B0T24DRAFT_605775 [Lasiosphaeria ovina]
MSFFLAKHIFRHTATLLLICTIASFPRAVTVKTGPQNARHQTATACARLVPGRRDCYWLDEPNEKTFPPPS